MAKARPLFPGTQLDTTHKHTQPHELAQISRLPSLAVSRKREEANLCEAASY
jgi:hypothetical protein